MKLWQNARIATCNSSMQVFENGALVTRGEKIEWVGAQQTLPETLQAGIT